MKTVKLSAIAVAALIASTTAQAGDEVVQKRTLKGNMMEVYKVLPKETNSVAQMFDEGEFYGRLRSNSFMWDWADDTGSNKDNMHSGLGGSMIYKTGKLGGFSFTAGMYYSQAFSDLNQTDIGGAKAGKDTFSRYKINKMNQYDLFSLAQAYVQYDIGKTTIKAGQQIWESLMTKSNDTKMIPNTFNGVSITSNDIENVKLRAFYFTSQKLRDHETNHDFVTFKDKDGVSWNNNDDAGVNKSLTYAKLDAAGMATSHHMNGADMTYTGIKGLKATFTHNMVPEIVLQEAAEVSYTMNVGGMKITPAARVIAQKGLTEGKLTNIANSAGNSAGYKNGNSLSGLAYMTKVNAAVTKGVSFLYGYSHIADMADMLAPWRGFVTGGYTRAMAQYNWNANTTTHMVQAKMDLGKLGILPGMTVMGRFAMQDFDDKKPGVQGDTNIFHMDIAQDLKALTPGLYAKFRLGMVSDARADTTEAQAKSNVAYNEYRFELNYLF